MKILITGARGFVGTRLLSILSKKHEVFSSTLNKENKSSSAAKLSYMDLSDKESIYKMVETIRPNCILHLAAIKSQHAAEENPELAFQINYEGTRHLADAAMQYAVEKMVVLSSVKASYPVSVYGLSKAMMEKQLMAYANRADTKTKLISIRLGNILGSPGTFLHVWQKMMAENKLIKSTGKGLHGFFITAEYLDKILQTFIEKELTSGLYIPKMKTASMEDFLKEWKEFFGTEYKFIETRNFDLPHEYLLNKSEMTKAYSFELTSEYESPFLFVGTKTPSLEYEIVRKEWSTENSSKFTAEEMQTIFSKIN